MTHAPAHETTDLLWPAYGAPQDLTIVETIPLADRGLPASTYDAVLRAAALWPERVAASVLPDGEHWDRPHEITFGDLAADVTRTANALRGLGVGRHGTVALLSPNSAGLLPALLGAQAAGIAAPVNPVLREHEVEELIARAGARVLVAAGPQLAPAVWELARGVASRLGVTALLALGPTLTEGPAPELAPLPGVRVAYLADLTADEPADRLIDGDAPTADDVAAVFHTGGTTGLPKLAAHTNRNEIADAWAVAAMSDLGPDAVILAALPLFHVNALVVTLLAPLLRGRPTLWAGPLGYRDQAFARAFWRVVERYRVAAMSGVPSVYAALAQLPVDADISSLQFCIVGAAPLPRAVVDAWQARTGLPLLEGYGLTEATCASSRSFPGHLVAGSAGQRLPYQQLKAVTIDPHSGAWTDLPPGQTGIIAIAGPTVFPGYLVGRDPDGRPVLDGLGKLHDGWLDTGDLGSVDADGFLRLSGRAKDVIIRGGHNIDPRLVEDALRSHPAVTDAAAVGRIDQHAGEVPVAYVTVHEPVDPAELITWATGHVAEPAAAPKDVVVVPELPHTAVGKLHKVPLRLDAARRELTTRLAELAVTVPDVGTWCTDVSGRITVTLTASDTGTAQAVADLLDRYALDHRLHVVDPTDTADGAASS